MASASPSEGVIVEESESELLLLLEVAAGGCKIRSWDEADGAFFFLFSDTSVVVTSGLPSFG